jgi:prepilin-type N-terminal cleavage/methylation domain-containing protein
MKKSLNNKAFVNFSSLSSERGFNLIEVLVAMMLISMALFAICSVLVFSSSTMHSVRKETSVTQGLGALEQMLSSQNDALVLIARHGNISDAAQQDAFTVYNSSCGSDISNSAKNQNAYGTAAIAEIKNVLKTWFNLVQSGNPDAKLAFSVTVTPTLLRTLAGNELPDAPHESWGPLVVDAVLVQSVNGECPELSNGVVSDTQLDNISAAIKSEALGNGSSAGQGAGGSGNQAGFDYQKSRIVIEYEY